jgi:hypothetical protein
VNSETGEVFRGTEEEVKQRIGSSPNWVAFNIGELVEVKGILFKVHEVSDQRLVLKFAKKA